MTSISFDISILELLWTLSRGFKVVLHGEHDTETIAEEIFNYGVTHFQSTPSLARMLATNPRSLAALRSLKILLLGGEMLPVSLCELLRKCNRGNLQRIWADGNNHLGDRLPPAGFRRIRQCRTDRQAARQYECLYSQFRSSTRFQRRAGGSISQRIWVSRGYWQRPELTADAFLPDHFARKGLMYRTGDVARVGRNGNLEFLGRTDFQVKLRGHRLELGEIEADARTTWIRQPGCRRGAGISTGGQVAGRVHRRAGPSSVDARGFAGPWS